MNLPWQASYWLTCKDSEQTRDVPDVISNKGPLISAPLKWWQAVGSYDQHCLWSTGVSKLGSDVNSRLEIHCGKASRGVPGDQTL